MSLINTKINPFTATEFVDGEFVEVDFKANAYKDGEFIEIGQEDIEGKWAIFFFYPADFTFVCPTELGDVADHYEELQKRGVEVFAVSTDTHFTHKAWHESSETIGKINYPMLGDPTHRLSNNFGVLRENEGVANRATFIIDPDGVIQSVEVTSEGIGRNAEEMLRKLKAAQYVRENPNEVCPAKWEEGADTLTPSLDLVGKI